MQLPWHPDFWVMRDDLYPTTGGGNKARKASRIIAKIESTGHRNYYDRRATIESCPCHGADGRGQGLALQAGFARRYLEMHEARMGNLLLMRLVVQRLMWFSRSRSVRRSKNQSAHSNAAVTAPRSYQAEATPSRERWLMSTPLVSYLATAVPKAGPGMS